MYLAKLKGKNAWAFAEDKARTGRHLPIAGRLYRGGLIAGARFEANPAYPQYSLFDTQNVLGLMQSFTGLYMARLTLTFGGRAAYNSASEITFITPRLGGVIKCRDPSPIRASPEFVNQPRDLCCKTYNGK